MYVYETPSLVRARIFDVFNHGKLMLTLHVSKTGKYDRIIATPRALSTCVLNWSSIDMEEKTIQNRIKMVRKKDPVTLDGLTMEIFRRNFVDAMEQAGCYHKYFDAHQGRYQSSVAKKHYLRNKYRAYNLTGDTPSSTTSIGRSV